MTYNTIQNNSEATRQIELEEELKKRGLLPRGNAILPLPELSEEAEERIESAAGCAEMMESCSEPDVVVTIAFADLRTHDLDAVVGLLDYRERLLGYFPYPEQNTHPDMTDEMRRKVPEYIEFERPIAEIMEKIKPKFYKLREEVRKIIEEQSLTPWQAEILEAAVDDSFLEPEGDSLNLISEYAFLEFRSWVNRG